MRTTKTRVESIDRIPSSELERIQQEFQSAGASTETFLNPDGTYKVQAIFDSGSVYPATGIRSL